MTKTIKKKTKKTSKTKKVGGLTGIMDPFSFMRRQKSTQKPQTITPQVLQVGNENIFDIYWINEELSCADVFPSFIKSSISISKTVKGEFSPNSGLSNFGISHGIHISKSKIYRDLNPDIICVTQLRRTWETAYTLFYEHLKNRNNNFYVCPYINEIRENIRLTNIDNQPENPEISNREFYSFKYFYQNILNDDRSINNIIPIDIHYLDKKNNIPEIKPIENISENEFKNNYLTNQPDFNKFMNEILPRLCSLSKNKKIAIITSKNIIEKYVINYNIKNPKITQYSSNLISTRTGENIGRSLPGDIFLQKYDSQSKKIKPSPEQKFPPLNYEQKYDNYKLVLSILFEGYSSTLIKNLIGKITESLQDNITIITPYNKRSIRIDKETKQDINLLREITKQKEIINKKIDQKIINLNNQDSKIYLKFFLNNINKIDKRIDIFLKKYINNIKLNIKTKEVLIYYIIQVLHKNQISINEFLTNDNIWNNCIGFCGNLYIEKIKEYLQKHTELFGQYNEFIPNIKQNFGENVYEIYWVNDEYSCLDSIKSFNTQGVESELYKTLKRENSNPHLSNFGISHATNIVNNETENIYKILNPDIICTSQLISTWETAYLLFNKQLKTNQKLFVCPYINDEYNSKDFKDKNDFNGFVNYLNEYINLNRNNEININFLNHNEKIPEIREFNNKEDFLNFKNNYYTDKPDFNKFITKILPRLCLLANKQNSNNTTKRIVIITSKKIIEKNLSGYDFSKMQMKINQEIPENFKSIRVNKGASYSADVFLQIYSNKLIPILLNNNNLLTEKNYLIKQVFPPQNKILDFDDFKLITNDTSKVKLNEIIKDLTFSLDSEWKENYILSMINQIINKIFDVFTKNKKLMKNYHRIIKRVKFLENKKNKSEDEKRELEQVKNEIRNKRNRGLNIFKEIYNPKYYTLNYIDFKNMFFDIVKYLINNEIILESCVGFCGYKEELKNYLLKNINIFESYKKKYFEKLKNINIEETQNIPTNFIYNNKQFIENINIDNKEKVELYWICCPDTSEELKEINENINFMDMSYIEKLSNNKYIKNINPDYIICSQKVNTWETANILFNEHLKKNNKLFISPELVNIKVESSIKNKQKMFVDFLNFMPNFKDISEINLSFLNNIGEIKQSIVLKKNNVIKQSILKKGSISEFLTNKENIEKFVRDVLCDFLIRQKRSENGNIKKVCVFVDQEFINNNLLQRKEEPYDIESISSNIQENVLPGDVYKQILYVKKKKILPQKIGNLYFYTTQVFPSQTNINFNVNKKNIYDFKLLNFNDTFINFVKKNLNNEEINNELLKDILSFYINNIDFNIKSITNLKEIVEIYFQKLVMKYYENFKYESDNKFINYINNSIYTELNKKRDLYKEQKDIVLETLFTIFLTNNTKILSLIINGVVKNSHILEEIINDELFFDDIKSRFNSVEGQQLIISIIFNLNYRNLSNKNQTINKKYLGNEKFINKLNTLLESYFVEKIPEEFIITPQNVKNSKNKINSYQKYLYTKSLLEITDISEKIEKIKKFIKEQVGNNPRYSPLEFVNKNNQPLNIKKIKILHDIAVLIGMEEYYINQLKKYSMLNEEQLGRHTIQKYPENENRLFEFNNEEELAKRAITNRPYNIGNPVTYI